VGGDRLNKTLGVSGHAFGAGAGPGMGEGLRGFVGPSRVAGSGGEPGQGEGAGLDRGNVDVGECQQCADGGKRAGEGLLCLGGAV